MPHQTVVENQKTNLLSGTLRRLLFMPESASLAHLGRLLTLAKGLPETSYEITFACDPTLRRWIPSPFAWRSATSLSSEEFRLRLARGKTLFDETLLHRQVKEDLAMFHEIRPTAVIGDFRPSLAISAPFTGLPHINVMDAHWSPWAKIPFTAPGPLETWWSRPLGSVLGKTLVDFLVPVGFRLQARPFNKVRRAYGLVPLATDIRSVYAAGDAVAYTDSAAWVPTPNSPRTHRHIGPVLWEPPMALPAWWKEIPQNRPTVFVSLGSTGRWNIFERVIDALRGMPVTTLVATSGRGTVVPIQNQMYVTDYLPGLETCKRADLVICNGGSGPVYQALSAGTPVIGIAANMDQMLAMAPVEQKGAGKCVPFGSAAGLDWVKEINALLASTTAHAMARRLGEDMAQNDSAQAFRRMLEEILRRTLP